MKKITIALCLLLSAFASAQDGVLDTSFGTNGVYTTVGLEAVTFYKLVDGKIMYRVGNKIKRLNTDGTLDTTFGVAGSITMTQPGTDNRYGFLVANNKVIAFSNNNDCCSAPFDTYYMGRYNMDGSVDTTLGSGVGYVTLDTDYFRGDIIPTLSLSGNEIWIAGNSNGGGSDDSDLLARKFTMDGVYINTVSAAAFGVNMASSSIGLPTYDGAVDAFVMSTGNLLVSATTVYFGTPTPPEGYGSGYMVVGGGSTASVRNNSYRSFYGSAKCGTFIDPNDNIYQLTGGVYGFNNVTAITNYIYKRDSNGTYDTTFGTGGELNIGVSNVSFQDLVVQTDGKLLVAGLSTSGTSATIGGNLILARFLPNGTIDTTFGTNGYISHDIAPTTATYNVQTGLFLSPDGTDIYLAGYNSANNAVFIKYSNPSLEPLIVPDFTPIAAICAGDAAPSLQVTSNNGVTGTWSPAVVSNTASGTYTFTPDANQHAATANLTVTVNQPTSSSLTETACDNYFWIANGTTYSSSGTYTNITTNTSGCTDTATLNLTINLSESPTGNSNQTISGNVSSDATISDIVVSPATVVWYASISDALEQVNALNGAAILTNGATYYAVNTNLQGCASAPFAVTVFVALATGSFDNAYFDLYPNPTSSDIYVKYNNEINRVSMMNVLGQEILSKSLNAREGMIETSNLPSGTYFVKLVSGDQIKTAKVIKQ